VTSVLFVRLSAMGDLVHGLGAIESLHRARPDWRLTVVTQTPFAPLLAGFPGVARVVGFDRRGGLSAFRRLRTALRCERYDVAIDLQGNWKSAAVAWLSGARLRLGAGAAWRQEPASRWLLHRTVPVAGPRHPARIAFALVQHLALDAVPTPGRLQATDAELATERTTLAGLGVDPVHPFRVLVVTDPADPRALRPRILAAEAAASAEPTVLLLGPAEASLPVPADTRVLRHRAGELRRLVALGQLVAAAGGLVIGPDQGASHVLAAAGARCLVAFGAQDPACTAPSTATVLLHPAPPPCAPCRRRRCRHADGPVCMEFTTAEARTVAPGMPWPTASGPR
jgi:ADP-heptose:LPS heptosyltransferase